jgi:hypothetical protein
MHELREERERLALAICGGEDAPGYANAQTVETLEKVARDNANATMAEINCTLAVKAKLAKALAGLDKAAALIEDRHVVHMTSKGRNPKYYISEWSLIAKEVRALLAEIEGEKG